MTEIADHWYEGDIECVACWTDMGHMCGYARVPVGHPWFDKGENDKVRTVRSEDVTEEYVEEAFDNYGVIPVFMTMLGGEDAVEDWQRTLGAQVRVHGGVTWANWFAPPLVTEEQEERWKDDVPGTWWLGFDCGHAGDRPDPEHMSERHLKFERDFRRKYPKFNHLEDEDHIWRLPEVRLEVKSLASQIAAVPYPRLLSRYGPAQRELRLHRLAQDVVETEFVRAPSPTEGARVDPTPEPKHGEVEPAPTDKGGLNG